MEIKILGPGCANCQKVEKLVREVVAAAAVAADIENQRIRCQVQFLDHVRRQPPEVLDDWNIGPGDVGVVREEKFLWRKLSNLDLPAILANHHGQREEGLRFYLRGHRKIVAVRLPTQVEEFVQPATPAIHARGSVLAHDCPLMSKGVLPNAWFASSRSPPTLPPFG